MDERDDLKRVMDLASSVFDAYSAVLFLHDRHAGHEGQAGEGAVTYHLAASFSLGHAIQRQVQLVPGQGVVGRMLATGEPLCLASFDRRQGPLGYYDPKAGEEATIKAFMGCPLRDGLGGLCVDSKQTYSFGGKDQRILQQFAQLVETMVADADETLRRREESDLFRGLQRIHELRGRFPKWSAYLGHFLDVLSETSGFEHVFLAARGETGGSYFLEGWNRPVIATRSIKPLVFSIGSGLIGWVFKNGQAVYRCGEGAPLPSGTVFGKGVKTPAFESVVCLPLHVHRRTRGVLVLAHEGTLAPSEAMRMFLRVTCEQLALFLETLYLKTRLTDPRDSGEATSES